jgi:glucose/arabinose dehydrogenase
VQPLEKIKPYRELGIGGIVRMVLEGKMREVYGVGERNSVGQDFNAKDGTLWFTDNQTDSLGDTVPPGELNHITEVGQDFGYPCWSGPFKVAGSAAAPELKNLPEPVGAVLAQLEWPAHQAQLGMTLYSARMFPEHCRSGIFAASHVSWNSTVCPPAR